MDALVGCKKYAGKSVRGPLFGIILSGDEKLLNFVNFHRTVQEV